MTLKQVHASHARVGRPADTVLCRYTVSAGGLRSNSCQRWVLPTIIDLDTWAKMIRKYNNVITMKWGRDASAEVIFILAERSCSSAVCRGGKEDLDLDSLS